MPGANEDSSPVCQSGTHLGERQLMMPPPSMQLLGGKNAM